MQPAAMAGDFDALAPGCRVELLKEDDHGNQTCVRGAPRFVPDGMVGGKV